jgi:hypothetical protein
MKWAQQKQKDSKWLKTWKRRRSVRWRNSKLNWSVRLKTRFKGKSTQIKSYWRVNEEREEILKPNWSAIMNERLLSIETRFLSTSLRRRAWQMTMERGSKSTKTRSRRLGRLLNSKPKPQLVPRTSAWKEELLKRAPQELRTTRREGRRPVRGEHWSKLKRRPTHLARPENWETTLTESNSSDPYHRKEAEVELGKVTKMEEKPL